MGKKLIAIGLSLFFVTGFPGLSKIKGAKIKTGERTLIIKGPFSGVQAKSMIEITYSQDNKPSQAIITGEENVVKEITYTIDSSGKLKFNLPKNVKLKEGIKIKLNGKTLTNYEAKSSGKITVTSPLNAYEDVVLTATSSGMISFKNALTTTQNIDILCASSGEIAIDNITKCNVLNLTTSSSGEINIKKANCDKFNCNESSSGATEIKALITKGFSLITTSASSAEIDQCIGEKGLVSAATSSTVEIGNATFKKLTLSAGTAANIKIKGSTDALTADAITEAKIDSSNLKVINDQNYKTSSGGKIIFTNQKKKK